MRRAPKPAELMDRQKYFRSVVAMMALALVAVVAVSIFRAGDNAGAIAAIFGFTLAGLHILGQVKQDSDHVETTSMVGENTALTAKGVEKTEAVQSEINGKLDSRMKKIADDS